MADESSLVPVLRGTRPQHSRGGWVVVEVHATGDGGRNIFRQYGGRRELGSAIAEGAAQLRVWTQPPISSEQPDVRKSCVQWRSSACGFRGVRFGEASNSGLPKPLHRRRGPFRVGSETEALPQLCRSDHPRTSHCFQVRRIRCQHCRPAF